MSDTIAYMLTNLLSSATITPSTEDSVYPKANLFDTDLANPLLGTSLTALTLTIDLGSSQALNTLLIGAHNFTSAAVVTVKAGNSASPSTVVATPTWKRHYIAAALGSLTVRYVTVEITDSNSEVLRIGEMGLGTRVVFPGSWLLGRGVGIASVDILQKTIKNVKHTHNLARYKPRDYQFRFTPTEAEDFEEFDEATQGIVNPFWLIEDATTSKVLYGHKESGLLIQETEDLANPPRMLYRLLFEEASKGSWVDT